MMALMMSAQGLFANQADEFNYDKQKVQDEFAELNGLEEVVIQNNFMSLSDMQSKNLLSSNFSNLNLSGSIMMEPALGIPGFWWGCVLGPVGILVVYLVTENDNGEVKKALYGCLVSAAFWIAWQVFWWVIYGNAFLF